MPVPRRAPPPNNPLAGGKTENNSRSNAINDSSSGNQRPRIDLNGVQATAPQPKLSVPTKRAAESQLTSNNTDTASKGIEGSAFKRARAENDVKEAITTVTPHPTPDAKKRVASVDPATLREEADGGIKRVKAVHTNETSTSELAVTAARKPSVLDPVSCVDATTTTATNSTCHSCQNPYPACYMLQLSCKGVDGPKTHAYCGDCLTMSFESAISDPTQCPPRCCSEVIPLASCKPLLSENLFRRFEVHVKPVESLFKPDPGLGLPISTPASMGDSNVDKGKGKSMSAFSMQAECVSCFEKFWKFDILQLPCKRDDDVDFHAYCRDCLVGLYESSITDPSLFPPRCCAKIIPLFSCTPYLSNGLIARFVEKKEELDTPNRIYCSNPDCSKWIRPVHVEAEVATCTACSQKTCTTCKGKQHDGLCPEDKGVKELMGYAEQNKWQTCPNCKNMVELNRGCYHIT